MHKKFLQNTVESALLSGALIWGMGLPTQCQGLDLLNETSHVIQTPKLSIVCEANNGRYHVNFKVLEHTIAEDLDQGKKMTLLMPGKPFLAPKSLATYSKMLKDPEVKCNWQLDWESKRKLLLGGSKQNCIVPFDPLPETMEQLQNSTVRINSANKCEIVSE